ncbi:MAG: histidine kinase dimerization/phospho-acceptor domain-containing protein [Gemmatimonadales bacterium]
MGLRHILKDLVGFDQMDHRPPLKPRFWVYCAAAYLIPVFTQVALPEDPGLSDEIVWLATLAPAFLLSLHYGLRGAFAGLLMGTALFMVVQLVLALNFTPDNWHITVPIYISYGTLAIAVGWLSEELHAYYHRALESERMAAIGQFAVAVRHEINNALTAIVTESQLLSSEGSGLTQDQQASAQSIHDAAMRIAQHVKKITNLSDAPVVTYMGSVKMLDIEGAQTRDAIA